MAKSQTNRPPVRTPPPNRAEDPRLDVIRANISRNADIEFTPKLLDDLRFFADNKVNGSRISFVGLQRYVLKEHGLQLKTKMLARAMRAAGRTPWWSEM